MTIDEIREQARRHVDAQAESARQRFVTRGDAQQAVYMLKRDEALRFAADPAPEPSAYPMLSAEVGITAPTLAEVADVVATMAAQWIAVAAQIETLRLGAKAAITAAATPEAVWSAARVTFPSP